MLTDHQITDLAKRMRIPLTFCGYKDELNYNKLVYNQAYIINMEDSVDENGKSQSGSHWVCLFVRQYDNGVIEPIYFDSFGMPPPEVIKGFVKQFTKQKVLPYNLRDIQSLLNNACGFYCG